MKTRLITAAVGIVVLLLVMTMFHTPVFEVILSAVVLLALVEIYHAFGFGKEGRSAFAGMALFALLVMFSGVGWIGKLVLPMAFVLVVYLAVCVVRRSQTLDVAKLGGMAMFGGMAVLCFYSFVYLKQLLPREVYGMDAVYFIFLILGFAWGGDSAAYFAGRIFGKHKLAPIVSPHKTVEGAVGGVLGSMVLGVAFTAVYSALGGGRAAEVAAEAAGLSFGGSHYLVVALLGGVASGLGILGDLFASAVKRQHGIKDYGNIFPGHGGILDRFDSVMFVAPFVTMGITALLYK